jgi:hypothetical protein
MAVIRSRLAEPGAVDPSTLQSVTADLSVIKSFAASRQVSGPDPRQAVSQVREAIVRWCNQQLVSQQREA